MRSPVFKNTSTTIHLGQVSYLSVVMVKLVCSNYWVQKLGKFLICIILFFIHTPNLNGSIRNQTLYYKKKTEPVIDAKDTSATLKLKKESRKANPGEPAAK